MKEIRIKLHSVTGLISNSSTTVIMCCNTYTLKAITRFVDAIVSAVEPGKMAADFFDIELVWDEGYIERIVEYILDDKVYQNEALPEGVRENVDVTNYMIYPEVKEIVDEELKKSLPEDIESGAYYDDNYEMSTKYLSITAKDGVQLPEYLAGSLYDIFEGVEICC